MIKFDNCDSMIKFDNFPFICFRNRRRL